MTDTPPPAGGISAESLDEYRRWLNSLNGIGMVLSERIVKAYPDYFELASSSSSQIVDRVKGLSEDAAKAILHAIASETMKAGAPAKKADALDYQNDERIARVSDVERSADFDDVILVDGADGPIADASDDDIDFLSQPLDFKPVMEARKHTPISIDALKQQHIDQQSAAGLRPGSNYQTDKETGDFVAYRKSQKNNLPAVPESAEGKPKTRRSIFLPVFLILVGLGLVGYSMMTLWQGDQPGGSGSGTRDPLVKFLTFDFLKKTDDAKPESTDDNTPVSTPVTTTLTPPAEIEPVVEPEPEPVVEPEPEPEPIIAASDISVSVLNGSGRTGAAGSGATVLRNAGYTVASTGNANNYAYEQTTIFFSSGNLAKAEKVLSDLSANYQPKLADGAYTGQTTEVVVVIGSR